jgi:hypothetical protein
MKPIEFLELDDVLQIHVDQIFRYDGTTEIRSPELLVALRATETVGNECFVVSC